MARKPSKQKPVEELGLGDALFASAREQFGEDTVVDLEEVLNGIKGVPLYRNLALQYVIGTDVLPLGRFYNVIGGWGSFKSSFCIYLAAMAILSNGAAAYCETENKLNGSQIVGILRHYLNLPKDIKECSKLITFKYTTSIEELLQFDIWIENYIRSRYEAGTLNDAPLLCINDSIGNVDLTENTKLIQDVDAAIKARIKAEKNGSEDAGGKVKGFSDARKAAFITTQMKAFGGHHMNNLPLSFLMINHQKTKIEQQATGRPGPAMTTESGGEHQRFQYSSMFELKGAEKVLIKGEKIPLLAIRTKKNCFASTGDRNIKVPYRSRWLGGKSGAEDIYLDWDAATAMLLTDEKEMTTVMKNAMRAIGFDIKREGNSYSSKFLGLDDVDAPTMGRAIHGNEELVSKLQQNVLQIRQKINYGILRKELFRVEPPDPSEFDAEPRGETADAYEESVDVNEPGSIVLAGG